MFAGAGRLKQYLSLIKSLQTGLLLATGMAGHGFGIGPGVGRVVADLVGGRAPGHDLARFRFGRFSDGSRVDLGPAL